VLAAMLRDGRWAREAPPARSGSQDVADAAQETEEEIVKVATLERRRQMLAQADKALCRLAAGRYGLCAECGKPIPTARLHALPFAVRCRPCQERFEWRARPGGVPVSGR
jgi:DnaK suppressor protein